MSRIEPGDPRDPATYLANVTDIGLRVEAVQNEEMRKGAFDDRVLPVVELAKLNTISLPGAGNVIHDVGADINLATFRLIALGGTDLELTAPSELVDPDYTARIRASVGIGFLVDPYIPTGNIAEFILGYSTGGPTIFIGATRRWKRAAAGLSSDTPWPGVMLSTVLDGGQGIEQIGVYARMTGPTAASLSIETGALIIEEFWDGT